MLRIQQDVIKEMAHGGVDEIEEPVIAGKWKEFINVMLSTNQKFK